VQADTLETIVARKPSLRVDFSALPALGLFYFFFLRPQMLKAGTLLGESQRRLPGDELIIAPGYQATRAMNIDAPPGAVWPWIAQIGRDGTGYYGLDGLTNKGIPSAAYIRADIPAPAVDMPLDGGCRILRVEPERLLLFGGFDLHTPIGDPMEQTTLFLLERRRDGSTRLLVRVRGYTYGMFGMFFNRVYEVFDYLNGMAQLQNIRQRAETMAHLTRPVSA
jgi:hypothetical protein